MNKNVFRIIVPGILLIILVSGFFAIPVCADDGEENGGSGITIIEPAPDVNFDLDASTVFVWFVEGEAVETVYYQLVINVIEITGNEDEPATLQFTFLTTGLSQEVWLINLPDSGEYEFYIIMFDEGFNEIGRSEIRIFTLQIAPWHIGRGTYHPKVMKFRENCGEGMNFIYDDHNNRVIEGTEEADCIWAGNGDDVVFGNGGDDIISGGNGKDVVFGDDGDDELYGNNGKDVIDGGDGDDYINGGNGTDICIDGETVENCEL